MKKSSSDINIAKKDPITSPQVEKYPEEVKQLFQEWKNLKHQMHEIKKRASQLSHDERHTYHELKKYYKSQRSSGHQHHHSHERQKSEDLKKAMDMPGKDVHIHYHHHHYYHQLPTEEQMNAIANSQNTSSSSSDEVEKVLHKLTTSSDSISKTPSPAHSNQPNGYHANMTTVFQPSPKKPAPSILLSQDKDVPASAPPASLNIPRVSSPQQPPSALDVQLAAAILQSQMDAEKAEEQSSTVIKSAVAKNTNASTSTFKIKLSHDNKEGSLRQFSTSSSTIASPNGTNGSNGSNSQAAYYGNLQANSKGPSNGEHPHHRSLSLPSRSALRASTNKLTANGPHHYVEPLHNSVAHPLMREEEFRIETSPLSKVPFSSIQSFVSQQPAAVGSIGRIFHGTLDGEPVAVKEIHKKDFQYHEVGMLKKITHPNIVQLLAYTETEDHLYIIAEWMKRDSLSKFLEYRQNSDRPLHYNEVLCLAIDIARGMSYLHRHEVNHCDLKLDNVFLNEDGVAKIADYGLAHVQSATKTKVLNAFRMFLPETFLLESISDKTDILAFGFILWQLTNGDRNCPKTMVKDTQNNLLKKPAISPSTPIVFENLIHECWHDNPSKRPSFDAILAKLMAPHPLLRPNEKIPVLLSREGVWNPLCLQDDVLFMKSRKEIKVISLDTSEVLHEITASTKTSKSATVTAALCDREMKYLFLAKKTFQIWSLETTTLVAEYDMKYQPKDISSSTTRSPSPELTGEHSDDITSMCFSHDHKKIFVGLSAGKIKVFKTKKMAFSSGNLDAANFETNNSPIYAMACTEKKAFVGTSNFIQVVNLADSALEAAPKHPLRLYPGEFHDEKVNVSAIATNECFIASGWTTGLIVIYDLSSMQPMHALDEFAAPINSISIMDGILVASSSDIMRMFREDETQTKWTLLMKTPGDSFVLNRKYFVVYSEKEGLYFESLL